MYCFAGYLFLKNLLCSKNEKMTKYVAIDLMSSLATELISCRYLYITWNALMLIGECVYFLLIKITYFVDFCIFLYFMFLTDKINF